jgi:uncharacterized protein YecE (DUF72 family)
VRHTVRIGTSGWHYAHWIGRFYPAGTAAGAMLALYAETFDTVEVNNTFYRLATPEAVAEWRATVPDGFLFAVKGSRYLTHMKKLKDPEIGLDRFLASVSGLGDALGPIVFQLPPRWHVNRSRLETFLLALPRDQRFAFEFRDPTWHTDEVADLLRAHRAAFCIFDIAGFQSPFVVTADFVYVRLHGPDARAYHGSYSPAQLRTWADRIRAWREEGRDVYVYFDNDLGDAVENARRLAKMVPPDRR